MPVFRSIVFAAALSGLLVGLVTSCLQQFGTVPLIARGEAYEKAEPKPAPHGHGADGHTHGTAGTAPATAEPDAWEPREGFERNALTVLFNILERIGFSLMLAGALVLAGRPLTWREGFLWGLAGFVVFVLAPGIGLPPELPGVPAAPLGPRQVWWIATACATAAGLGLIVFRPSPLAAAAGIGLIAAPHLVGAPELAGLTSEVPAALSHRFVVAVLLTTLLSWTLLGALTGYFGRRFMAVEDRRAGAGSA